MNHSFEKSNNAKVNTKADRDMISNQAHMNNTTNSTITQITKTINIINPIINNAITLNPIANNFQNTNINQQTRYANNNDANIKPTNKMKEKCALISESDSNVNHKKRPRQLIMNDDDEIEDVHETPKKKRKLNINRKHQLNPLRTINTNNKILPSLKATPIATNNTIPPPLQTDTMKQNDDTHWNRCKNHKLFMGSCGKCEDALRQRVKKLRKLTDEERKGIKNGKMRVKLRKNKTKYDNRARKKPQMMCPEFVKYIECVEDDNGKKIERFQCLICGSTRTQSKTIKCLKKHLKIYVS